MSILNCVCVFLCVGADRSWYYRYVVQFQSKIRDKSRQQSHVKVRSALTGVPLPQMTQNSLNVFVIANIAVSWHRHTLHVTG